MLAGWYILRVTVNSQTPFARLSVVILLDGSTWVAGGGGWLVVVVVVVASIDMTVSVLSSALFRVRNKKAT